MWPASPTMRAWHDAISDLFVHTADCAVCQSAEKWDQERRCANGQALYRAEQAAYAEHIAAEYAGRAVA